MKNIMKEAHEMTKRIIKAGDNYRATFRLCLIFAHSQKGENKMVELVGSEKQVKWASEIRENLLNEFEEFIIVTTKEKREKIEEINKRKYMIRTFGYKKSELGTSEEVTKAIYNKLSEIKNILVGKEKASFYITHRFSGVQGIIELYINKEL